MRAASCLFVFGLVTYCQAKRAGPGRANVISARAGPGRATFNYLRAGPGRAKQIFLKSGPGRATFQLRPGHGPDRPVSSLTDRHNNRVRRLMGT